ncbi:MAG: hypothetical protein ABIJ17_01080 [Patescibacteria group bacterium]
MENINYFWRVFMTTNTRGYFDTFIKLCFAGSYRRNQIREEIAKRMSERNNYAGRIAMDAADDKLSELLQIKKEIVAGYECVTYEKH